MFSSIVIINNPLISIILVDWLWFNEQKAMMQSSIRRETFKTEHKFEAD